MTIFRSYCLKCKRMTSFAETGAFPAAGIVTNDGRAVRAKCYECNKSKRVVRAK